MKRLLYQLSYTRKWLGQLALNQRCTGQSRVPYRLAIPQNDGAQSGIRTRMSFDSGF